MTTTIECSFDRVGGHLIHIEIKTAPPQIAKHRAPNRRKNDAIWSFFFISFRSQKTENK